MAFIRLNVFLLASFIFAINHSQFTTEYRLENFDLNL